MIITSFKNFNVENKSQLTFAFVKKYDYKKLFSLLDGKNCKEIRIYFSNGISLYGTFLRYQDNMYLISNHKYFCATFDKNSIKDIIMVSIE